jgi:hypothetical protein
LFLQDIAAPYKTEITHHKLADIHFEVPKHLDYSPDLVPSDYCLLPNFKRRNFSSNEETTLAADRWFATQPINFFLNGLKKSQERSLSVWRSGGHMYSKYFYFSVP